jgi:cellulose synthase operon protein C
MAKSKSPSVPRPSGAGSQPRDNKKKKELSGSSQSGTDGGTSEPERSGPVEEFADDELVDAVTDAGSEPPTSVLRSSAPPAAPPRPARPQSETPPPPRVRSASIAPKALSNESRSSAAPGRPDTKGESEGKENARPLSATPPPRASAGQGRVLPPPPRVASIAAPGSRLPAAPPAPRRSTGPSGQVTPGNRSVLVSPAAARLMADATSVDDDVEEVQEVNAAPPRGERAEASVDVSPVPPPLAPRAPAVSRPDPAARSFLAGAAGQAPTASPNVSKGLTTEVVKPAKERLQPLPGFSKWTPGVVHLRGNQDSDIAPTRFDLEAGQRHASPWTEEKRQQTQMENARTAVELFEGQLKDETDKLRRSRLHYEAARLYESPLREFEQAAKHFEQTVKLQPNHIPSIRGARRSLLALHRHKAACRFFDLEVEHSTSAEQKALLLYEKSLIVGGPLGAKAEARDVLREAIAFTKAELSLVKAALLAEEHAGNWERFADLSKSAANLEAENPKERAAYLAQSARASFVQLKDAAAAIELYKAALELEPQAPGALDALKDLLYASGRFKELVAVLQQEAEWASTAEVKGYCWFRAGRILFERLSDAAAATNALEWASQILPQDRTILDELVRIYELTGNYNGVVSAAERIVALTQPPPLDLLHRLAEIYEEQLNEPERAIERLSSALHVDATYRPALLALGRLREQRGEWRELAEMLNAESELSNDPEHRASLHLRMAEICETQLKSETYAVEHHKQALALRPGYEPSFKALVRLHTTARRFHDVVELYERQLETALTKEERLALLFAMGRLQEDAIGEPHNAIRTYRRVLEEDTTSLEGLAALQRAAERASAYDVLVEALDLEAKQSDHKVRVLALKHRAAVIVQDKLGETNQAIERLEAIVKLEKAYMPTIEALQRIYYREGRLPELLQSYERELDTLKQGAHKANLLVKMGELAQRKLGHSAEAIGYYKRALQADETNAVALRGLRVLLSQTGDFAEVAKLLGTEAETSDGAELRARLWLLQGEVYEHRLNAPEKALGAYRRALLQQPSSRPAAEGCVRILALSQDFKKLEEELAKDAERAPEPSYTLAASFRRGEVQRDRLGQNDEAVASFREVLKRDPSHVGALFALERLSTLQDRPEQLTEVLQYQTGALSGISGRVAALRTLRALTERQPSPNVERLKELDTALLALSPNDQRALFKMEALAIAQDDYVLLSQVDAKLAVLETDRASAASHQTRLAEAMEARGDFSAIEVYRAAVAHDAENLAAARGISRIAERSGKPELLAVAAETEATQLHRPAEGARLLVLAASKLASASAIEGAIKYLARALQLAPNDQHAATALSSLVERGAAAEAVIAALSEAAGAATERERRSALWTMVAHHQSGRHDVGAAVAAAKRAIKEQPNSVDGHVLLSQLHAASRKWQDCVTVLQDLLKLNPPEAVRFDAYLQTAFIQHEHLKATTLAATNVSSALALRPDSREAIALLLRVQLSRDDLRKASETAARLVAASTTPEDLADAQFQSARVEQQRGEPEKAMLAYEAALGILGSKGRVAKDFRDYLDSLGTKADWQPYVNGWQEYLKTASVDAETEKAIRQEIGRVLYDKLGSRDDGISSLRDALRMNPGDYTLRRELAERLERAGHFDVAVEQFQLLIQAAPQTASFWRSLSHCYSGLGNDEHSRVALAPLIAAGDATSDERRRYAQVAPRGSALRASGIGSRELHTFQSDAQVDGPAVEVVAALQPALSKLYPVPWETYAVSSRDKAPSTSSGVVGLAREVAAALGLLEIDTYLHRSKREGVSIEMGDEPLLFINERVASLPRAEQVFWLASALAHLAQGTAVVHMLPPLEVALLVACATRIHVPTYGLELADAASLDVQSKRISKAMPWFKGNRLEPAALKLASSSLDHRAWVENARVAAARIGALLSDDLATSLRLSALAGVQESFVPRVARFHLSEAADDLRRRVFT